MRKPGGKGGTPGIVKGELRVFTLPGGIIPCIGLAGIAGVLPQVLDPVMKAAQPESDLDAIGHDLACRQASLPISPDREEEGGRQQRGELGREFSMFAKRTRPGQGQRRADAGQANLQTADNGTAPSAVRRFLTPDLPGLAQRCRRMATGGCASLGASRGTL